MTERQQKLFSKNPNFKGIQIPTNHDYLKTSLEKKLSNVNADALQIIKVVSMALILVVVSAV